jgi:CheY-like chemotaxis protein
MNEAIRQILLIEDNHDDVFLMRRAVRKATVPWQLNVASDGQAALDYLHGTGDFADRNQFPFPSLVFLDLKLPYVSGFDVLTSMKTDEKLKDVPVVVLTSSPEERDQRRAMQLGAEAYLIKPPSEGILQSIARGDWANSRMDSASKPPLSGDNKLS